MKQNAPNLVVFKTQGCPECQSMEKEWESLAETCRLKGIEVNIDSIEREGNKKLIKKQGIYAQLIEYFGHDKMKELIDYIIVVADPKEGAERGRKLPFLADKIFALGINQMIDKFFEAPDQKIIQEQSVEDEDEVLILDGEPKENELEEINEQK